MRKSDVTRRGPDQNQAILPSVAARNVDRGSDASGDSLAMDTPATYVQLGFLVISVPNLMVIIGMVVVFLAALVAPFPHIANRDGFR